MAMNTDATTTSEMTCGQTFAINNMSKKTYMLWYKLTTDISPNPQRIIERTANSGTADVLTLTAASEMQFQNRTGGTGSNYITSGLNAGTSTWYFLGASYNDENNPNVIIVQGSATVTAYPRAFGTATQGTGGKLGDDQKRINIGNRDALNGDRLAGNVAWLHIASAAFSAADMIAQQYSPFVTTATVALLPLGYSTGTLTMDISGHKVICGGVGTSVYPDNSDGPPVTLSKGVAR